MQRILQSFFLYSFCLMLAACIPPRVNNRGHVDAFDRLKDVNVGVTTRDDIQTMLGSPSITNNFGEEIWYYVHHKKEAVAFLEPEITEQNVTRITFNAQGVVSGVTGYDSADRKDIAIASETTPTEGHELGVLEQLLGNVGRFNASDTQRSQQPTMRR